MAASADIFVRAKAKNYGPYNEGELGEHIQAGRIPFSAWVYWQGSWQLLAALPELRSRHPDFQEAPQETPTKKNSQAQLDSAAISTALYSGGASAAAGTVSAEPIWFVIRDKKKFGPYSAAEIIGQLQGKALDSSAFVWRPGFATWQRLNQVGEFSKESMKKLATEGPAVDILVKRKYVRAPYDVEVIAHDNTRALEGKTMVIGEGGLFLALSGAAGSRPSHPVGARLKLHFREGDAPSFNAVAEIVSVVRGISPGYCLRFVAISDADKKRIAKFVSENAPKRGK